MPSNKFSLRKKRLEALYAEELSKLLLFEVQDPRLAAAIISLTRVEFDATFSTAAVFFTVLEKDNKNKVLKALYSSANYFSLTLRSKIKMRKHPVLKFFYDFKAAEAQENG